MELRQGIQHAAFQKLLQGLATVVRLLLPHSFPEAFIVDIFPLLLQHPGIEQGFLQVNRFVAQSGQGGSALLLKDPGDSRLLFAAPGQSHSCQHHKDSQLL